MTSTTTTTQQLGSIEEGLTLLAANLVKATREDGSEYRMLRQDCPMHDFFQEVVRECHMGELPNDWRFETIYDLCHGLLDYSQPDEEAWDEEAFRYVLPEVADSLAGCSTSLLLQWLADQPSRCEFNDDCTVIGQHTDIAELARLRQAEEIETMGRELIAYMDNLIES